MALVIAQLSDIHIGGPNPGSGERFSAAIHEINEMQRQPDLVLLTGDNTHNGTADEWAEVVDRLTALRAPWDAINGNHDRPIEHLAGHRVRQLDGLRLVLLDTSDDEFSPVDAEWLDRTLSDAPDSTTCVAMHHPPFETGIWWMDVVGLRGADRVETVVRRHPQVVKLLSGHVHRPIQAAWGTCSLWVCPSTSVSVAGDISPEHDPAETAEPPAFSLHTFLHGMVVSHVVPVGPAAIRSPIEPNAPEFVRWAREQQLERRSAFTST